MTRTSNSSRPLYISMSTACERGGMHVILPSESHILKRDHDHDGSACGS